MRSFAAVLAITIAAGAGLGLYAWRVDDAASWTDAPTIAITDPLPPGSVTVRFQGSHGPETIAARPGLVIEATHRDSGHAPCSTLQVHVGVHWVDAFHMSGAFSDHPDAIFGRGTGATRVEENAEFTVVCPAMNMIGDGPERFRLPMWTPDHAARLCIGGNRGLDCIGLEYR